MKALIIYTHPNPASFNAAILKTIRETLTEADISTEVRDLYTIGFNPVLSGAELGSVFSGQGSFDDARQEQQFIAEADLVIFIYPIWWFNYPAILKGYIDRVLSAGFAFEYTARGPRPLLSGKKAYIVQTGGNKPEVYKAMQLNGLPGAILDRGTLQFTGFQTRVKTLLEVISISDAERKKMLHEVAADLTEFAGIGEFVMIS